MTTAELIDKLVNWVDNTDATDADNALRRQRFLVYAQQTFDEVWHSHPWTFKMRFSTVTIPAGTGFTPLPLDFGSFGPNGGVYSPTGRKLGVCHPQELLVQRELPGSGTLVSEPYYYSIFGFDPVTALPLIQIPTVVNDVDLKIWYEAGPATLVDSAVIADSMLYFIPTEYHQTVLWPGGVAKAAKSLGDQRNWEQAYQLGLAKMIIREMPRREGVQKLPRAIVGKW